MVLDIEIDELLSGVQQLSPHQVSHLSAVLDHEFMVASLTAELDDDEVEVGSIELRSMGLSYPEDRDAPDYSHAAERMLDDAWTEAWMTLAAGLNQPPLRKAMRAKGIVAVTLQDAYAMREETISL